LEVVVAVFGAQRPAFGAGSRALGAMSAEFVALSPTFGAMSPAFGAMSAEFEAMSPAFKAPASSFVLHPLTNASTSARAHPPEKIDSVAPSAMAARKGNRGDETAKASSYSSGR